MENVLYKNLKDQIKKNQYKEWSGTQAEYAAAVAQGLIADGTIVTITDSPTPTGTLEEHVSTLIHSANGIHGIRYYQDKLEYYDETTETWVEIETGSDITIDSDLSSTSTNPVQNKTINAALNGKLGTSGNSENVTVNTFTTSSASMPTLTAGETLKVLFGKLVKWMSDVASALSGKQDKLTSKGSTTKGVYVDSNGTVQAMTYEVNKTVPSDAVFTDTTYESKSASSGGTATSLVTTGEKYTWNNKVDSVSIGYTGTASSSAVRYQRIGVADAGGSTSYTEINGTKYMERSITTSTSTSVNATFSDAAITTSSVIDVYTSQYGLNHSAISVSSGSCTVTFPAQSSAATVTVRIYIR